MKFTRTFSANVGQKSTGTAGPDQIEYDLDQIAKNLDPVQTGGGVGPDNMTDFTVNQAIATVEDNIGTPTEIMSWFAKALKVIKGTTNWYDSVTYSLVGLKILIDNVVLGQIPDGTLTDAKLSSDAADIKTRVASHLAETMPHRFTDGTTTYKWGLSVVGGVVNMIYEEVV